MKQKHAVLGLSRTWSEHYFCKASYHQHQVRTVYLKGDLTNGPPKLLLCSDSSPGWWIIGGCSGLLSCRSISEQRFTKLIQLCWWLVVKQEVELMLYFIFGGNVWDFLLIYEVILFFCVTKGRFFGANFCVVHLYSFLHSFFFVLFCI